MRKLWQKGRDTDNSNEDEEEESDSDSDFGGVYDAVRMLLAEFLGTLLMMFLGGVSIVYGYSIDLERHTENIDNWFFIVGQAPIYIGLAFGAIVDTLTMCFVDISGGHFNPAVTLGHFIVGDIKIVPTLMYAIAQMLGAAAGAALMKVVQPDSILWMVEGSIKVRYYRAWSIQLCLMEGLITFPLVLVHIVSDPSRMVTNGFGALVVGLSIMAGHVCAFRYSGSHMNPARSFGPAVVLGYWEYHWVYWVGPIVAGIAAGALHRLIFIA